jgi:hypothetical protein
VNVFKSGTSELVQVVRANAAGGYQVNGLPVIFTYDLNATAAGHAFVFGPVGAGVAAGTVTPGNDIFMT